MTLNGKKIAALILAAVLLLGIAGGLLYDHHRAPSSTGVKRAQAGPIAPLLPAPLATSPTILFYGGSITAGLMAATPEDTYRSLVVSATSANGPSKPTVVAQKGVQTYSFLQKHPVPPVAADLTIIELGTNDVGKTKPSVFRETYRTLLNSIRKDNRDGQIVCMGTWTNSKSAQAYDAAIYDECVAQDGRPVLLTSVYALPINRGPEGAIIGGEIADNFLPNTVGHRAIAQMVMSVVPLDTTPES